MDIVQKLDKIFCRHQLDAFDLCCDLIVEFFIDFCLDNLSVGDRGVLKFPTSTVLESVYMILGLSEYV
jgi:hypothetical protein